MVEYKLSMPDIGKIEANLLKVMSDPLPFWEVLAAKMDQWTKQSFNSEGARAGHPAWPKLKASTLATKRGTPKIRYGTNLKPKKTREQLAEYKTKKGYWYRPGIMPGYEGIRRYQPNSKALQASRGFFRSFKVQEMNQKKMIYGTQHELASKIMSVGPREVVFLMPNDYIEVRNLWKAHIKKRMSNIK